MQFHFHVPGVVHTPPGHTPPGHTPPPPPAAVDPRIDRLLTLVLDIQQRIIRMSGSLDTEIADLTKKVANLTTVDASATELIKGFSQKLQDAVAAAKSAGVQDAQLQSLTDLGSAIDNATSGLAAAVAQGTTSTDAPAAPAPAPAPAPAATDPAAPAAADPAAAAPAPTAP